MLKMKVYGIVSFNEDKLKTLLSVLDESKRVAFEDIKLPRTDLLRKADNGDEEAIKTIKKYIAEDCTETTELADL